MSNRTIPKKVSDFFQGGTVINALPLALNQDRKWDKRRRRTLIRYNLEAGAGSVAVHTTNKIIDFYKMSVRTNNQIKTTGL
ncbi:hypothetical protein K8352_15140 [Flavobacteriaceae bacterium F89]|uniref:Uncharacterized protein n=1 Tax=Cerina litoralis TaxID=2874477 RepID=A0AAE3EXK0_9FLAO|nr:hypothetical protein [Cerina litoralis]MCG2462093.1 hypothetical protein [Cerina litoralis]